MTIENRDEDILLVKLFSFPLSRANCRSCKKPLKVFSIIVQSLNHYLLGRTVQLSSNKSNVSQKAVRFYYSWFILFI